MSMCVLLRVGSIGCMCVCTMFMCLTDHKNSHYASEPGRWVLREESETNPNGVNGEREKKVAEGKATTMNQKKFTDDIVLLLFGS